MIKATLWDVGGVIFTGPFERFAAYEVEHGLPDGFIRRLNATNPDSNAWARLERSEIAFEEFCAQHITTAPHSAVRRGAIERPQRVGVLADCR